MNKIPSQEIAYCRRILESAGFLIREPKEIDIPVIVEVGNAWDIPGNIAIRLEIEYDGNVFYHRNVFPFELLCDPDDPEFRDNEAPRILCHELGNYLAGRLEPAVKDALSTKIKPFIPEKRLSPFEIQAFVEAAVSGRYSDAELRPLFPKIYRED